MGTEVAAGLGLNADCADATMSVKGELLTPPCTLRAWLRPPQAAGLLNTTLLMLNDEPRSTWAHCGNALFTLSQYVPWLPSTVLPDGYTSECPLSLVGRPAARLLVDVVVP